MRLKPTELSALWAASKRRGKGAGFSDEIETRTPTCCKKYGVFVVRARGSQMRLKRRLETAGLEDCRKVVRARGSQMRLKQQPASPILDGMRCGKGAGFSDEIETRHVRGPS